MGKRNCTNCRFYKSNLSDKLCDPSLCIPRGYRHWCPVSGESDVGYIEIDCVSIDVHRLQDTCSSCHWCEPMYSSKESEYILSYVCLVGDSVVATDQCDYSCDLYEESMMP